MTPSPPSPHPDDETEQPDVHTVPQGAVAVFRAPRGRDVPEPAARPAQFAVDPPAPAGSPAQPGGDDRAAGGSVRVERRSGANGRPRRADIESPFLDFFGHPTVDGSVVEGPQPRGDLSALAGAVPPPPAAHPTGRTGSP
ncbi:MAG TPA: hypothetical protein VHA75_05375, partial [Rugosimonospora sp.]|nr:hypothetical protein [Rugosimonospora sp.]